MSLTNKLKLLKISKGLATLALVVSPMITSLGIGSVIYQSIVSSKEFNKSMRLSKELSEGKAVPMDNLSLRREYLKTSKRNEIAKKSAGIAYLSMVLGLGMQEGNWNTNQEKADRTNQLKKLNNPKPYF